MEILLKDIDNVINLSDEVFNVKLNVNLVHQVVKSYFVNKRKCCSIQKSRSLVSGSNKKPWKQKGTGKARSGSYKSPLWRSGGVTFASKYVDYYSKINKKVFNKALKGVLSQLIKTSRIHIFSEFYIEKPKTKLLVNKLNSFNILESLIIVSKIDRCLFLSSRNLYKVCVCSVNNIKLVNLINYKNTIFTLDSIKIIEGRLLK